MTYLAIDFGGGSGRVVAGTITTEGGKKQLTMQLVHRFQNRQVRLGEHVYWDFPALFEDMKTGLRKAAQLGLKVSGIAVDTWGVDFGLIDRNGDLIGNPVCYRDARTQGMADEFFVDTDRTAHYSVNGTQVMEINTLFQLLSLKKANSPQLQIADKLLFTPDLFSYFLTGEANTEYTIASTSEMLNATNATGTGNLSTASSCRATSSAHRYAGHRARKAAQGHSRGDRTGRSGRYCCRFARHGECRSGGSG